MGVRIEQKPPDIKVKDPLDVKSEGLKIVVKEGGKILTREQLRQEVLKNINGGK